MRKNHNDLVGWTVGCLISKWTTDQFKKNAVTVHIGHKSLEFIKLADGTYSSPPGITSELIYNDSTYTLKERFDSYFTFNSDNLAASYTNADGYSLTFFYLGDKLKWIADSRPMQQFIIFYYLEDEESTKGMIESIVDRAYRRITYSYDDNYNLTGYTDPEGKVWSYSYDSDHRMTSLTSPHRLDPTQPGITTAMNTYDSLGRIATQVVPRQGGQSATYNFFFTDFQNIEEDPYGNQKIYYYDEMGRNIGEEDDQGHINRREYDSQNQIVLTIDPLGNCTSFEYDKNLNLQKMINALGFETNYIYDERFRKTEIINPFGNMIHFDYDDEHHLTGTTTYPKAGKEIHTSINYYDEGFIHSTVNGGGTITSVTYDGYWNLTTKQSGSEPPINYVSDPIGNVNSLTDQANAVTNFDYDDRELPLNITDPLNKATSFTYYNDGLLQTKTDRKGDTLYYYYTPSSKLETITNQDTYTVNFSYDLHDNLVEMHDTLGTTTYSYDTANRLKSIRDPHSFVISYSYDEAGNVKEIIYPGYNKKVSYNYDALNRMKTITINWLGLTATYNYDSAGRLSSLNQFNGTTTSYGYDNADRLISLEIKKSDNSKIAAYKFILDNNGNRTHISAIEPLEPTLSEIGIDYTYNEQKNRLTTAGGTSFSYDGEGQLLDAGGVPYSFDCEHRLISAGGAIPCQYFYDGAGRRLKAIRNGVTTHYIYDASGNLLAEASSGKVITRYFIYGHGLLAMVSSSNKRFCYHFNPSGSTIAITDNVQKIVNKYAYGPFGEITGTQEIFTQPFKYVGQHGVMTEPNGLYYMRARYYDPQTGRFISEDPIGFEGGDTNLYVYAGNNPVNLVDPWGLWAGGVSLEISTINPFTSGGGGSYGFNLEYTSSSGWHLYTYNTPKDVGSIGWTPGISLTGNIAAGTGDWTGPFESGAGSFWFLTGGYFHTPLDQPDPGYFGLTFGGSLGPPGLGFTKTEYHRTLPESTQCK